MKDTTRKMLDQLDAAHDWARGQTYGGSGTRLSRTDLCRVCNLRRHWLDDSQNNIDDQTRFSDGETGEDLSLRQAMARGCA